MTMNFLNDMLRDVVGVHVQLSLTGRIAVGQSVFKADFYQVGTFFQFFVKFFCYGIAFYSGSFLAFLSVRILTVSIILARGEQNTIGIKNV